MAAKVPDASVIAALLFGEPDAALARKLIAGSELYAPALLPFELANVALKKILRWPRVHGDLLTSLRAGLSMGIQLMDVDHAETVELARTTGLSSYDASYLWVAREIGGELVTFDATLKKAAKHV
jgi:predicted nucleic acid-binding protein